MKLYFGNTITAATTIMILSLIAMVTYTFISREGVNYWGRRTLLLGTYGLVICCFAAARDGLDKTIQAAIDGSCAPGIFSLVSIPTIAGCIGAVIIVFAGIITIFVRKQDVREVLYFVMSGGVILKILTIVIISRQGHRSGTVFRSTDFSQRTIGSPIGSTCFDTKFCC